MVKAAFKGATKIVVAYSRRNGLANTLKTTFNATCDFSPKPTWCGSEIPQVATGTRKLLVTARFAIARWEWPRTRRSIPPAFQTAMAHAQEVVTGDFIL